MYRLYPVGFIILLVAYQQQGYTITSEGNPNVKWETSTQTDIGLDLGLFKNALQLHC
jgi:outer membrane receptor protein involved in Fe transport